MDMEYEGEQSEEFEDFEELDEENHCAQLFFQPDHTAGDVPMNAQQYLTMVREEAKGLDDVTCASPSKRMNTMSSNIASLFEPSTTSRLEHIPSQEWEQNFLRVYEKLRSDVSRGLNMSSPNARLARSPSTWCNLFSKEEAPSTASLISKILHIDIEPGLEALEMDCAGMDGDGSFSIDLRRARWFYAFLTRLQTPVMGDTISTIRSLIKGCIKYRLRLEADNEVVPMITNLVTISRLVFGQGDLK